MTGVGGDRAALRSRRVGSWISPAAAALGLAAATGLLTVATAEAGQPHWRHVGAWLVAAGLVALVVGLAGRLITPVGIAVVCLGAAYAACHVHAGVAVAASAVLTAPALLLVAEFAAWSLDLHPLADAEPGTGRDRAGWVLAVGSGGGAVAAGLAATARVHLAGALPLDALAITAVVALIALVARVATQKDDLSGRD